MKLNSTALIAVISIFAAVPQVRAQEQTPLTEAVQLMTMIEQQLEILKKNAGSCGFVGGQVASRMDDSMKAAAKERGQILSAVASGAAGIPTIEGKIALAVKNLEQLQNNISMVRFGLSTDSATCKTASAAFEKMNSLQGQMPNKLRAIVRMMKETAVAK